MYKIMENASKALIMAGAILLAILIISLGVMVFRNMSNSVVNDTSLDKQTITAFNSKIQAYVGNNKTGSQVNTLRDIVISINNNAKVQGGSLQNVKEMKIDGDNAVTYNISSNIVTISGTKADTSKFYRVDVHYNEETGLIDTITATVPTNAE